MRNSEICNADILYAAKHFIETNGHGVYTAYVQGAILNQNHVISSATYAYLKKAYTDRYEEIKNCTYPVALKIAHCYGKHGRLFALVLTAMKYYLEHGIEGAKVVPETEQTENNDIMPMRTNCTLGSIEYPKPKIPTFNIAQTNKQPEPSSLNQLKADCYNIAYANGWHEEERKLPELIALIHSEASEALEEYRDNKPPYYLGTNGKPEGVLSELADVVIRVFDAVECLYPMTDFEGIIKAKNEYNKTRGHRHGGKKC